MGGFMLQATVDRELFFKFKHLCRAHGITLSRGVEELLRDALARAGVEQVQIASCQDRQK